MAAAVSSSASATEAMEAWGSTGSKTSAGTALCTEGFREAEAYAEQCRRLLMPVETSIAVWLRLGGESLEVPHDSSLLPACEFLSRSTALRRLSLRCRKAYGTRGAGNANARVLRYVLAKTTSLQVLDLSQAGIDSEGVNDLCEGLRRNRSLRKLSLRGNFLGARGGKILAEFLADQLKEVGSQGKTTLRQLDVSTCSIGYEGVQRLAEIAGFKAVYTRTPAHPQEGAPLVDVANNFETEELWNAITHGIMLAFGILGTVKLLMQVSNSPSHHVWGASIFSFALLFCFASSTFYHSLFLYPRAHKVLQVLDHTAIYVLIAGSYTPFLIFYSETPAHIDLLKAEWILCGLGIIAHICSQYADWGTSTLYITGELLLYLAMGWAAVVIWDSFSVQVPAGAFGWLLGGGILYTAGVPFFLLADYRPIHHVIWHLFVAAAAVCHWFAVKEAAADAFLNHSQGPFGPDVEWWTQRFHDLKDELVKLHNTTQDHGLYRTLTDHIMLLPNLTRLNRTFAGDL
eukprot:TRINITY_DN31835_c0_g1_i1.p1 TRINITY_DN31835_c0_g1~~TRINITY_DN31835_c0_g1_i1.p1  ORF type:complete len:525 (-),score=75.82 TRINITY_DN31835_c0_g1_i1:70-1614(-)